MFREIYQITFEMSEIVGSELKKPELLHKINGYYKMDLEVLLVVSSKIFQKATIEWNTFFSLSSKMRQSIPLVFDEFLCSLNFYNSFFSIFFQAVEK